MAENLFSVSDPVILSDEENVQPNRRTRTMYTSSSDSDSDCEGRPPLKKKRSSTVRRNINRAKGDNGLSDSTQVLKDKVGLTSVTSVRSSSETRSGSMFGTTKSTSIFTSSVYSGAISGSFPLRSHVLDPAIAQSLNETNEESDEIEDIFTKKTVGKKQHQEKKSYHKKVTETNSSHLSTRQRRQNRPISPDVIVDEDQNSETIQEYQPKVIFLEDEETDVDCSDTESRGLNNSDMLSTSQTRDPTPPPTPSADECIGSQRAKRRKRAVKNALSALERVKVDHEILSIGDDGSDDAEVSVIEVYTPTKSNERELIVKVRSRSGIQRFPMQMGQSFASVFRDMAEHEFVNESQISMFLGDNRINSYDTPENLNLKVADIIDCYIRKAQDSANISSDDESDPNHLKVRVQGKDSKSQVTVYIGRDEPMEKLMRKYAKQKNLDYDKLNFQFDGEEIHPRDTPADLDLEDSFCVDVINM